MVESDRHEKQSVKTTGDVRSIHLAGLHSTRLDRQRRVATLDRGVWIAWNDLESGDLWAITESHDYDADIQVLARKGKNAKTIYETISQCDVQSAADVFRPIYENSGGIDGYVSLEVNPHLAHDTAGTIDEARRLWRALNRPNVFIKVPASVEGLPAIQQLISEGINVNVTLIFGLPRYRQVAEAYIAGLEARAAQGRPVNHVSSVASFFVSRIDALIDPLLENQSGDLAKKAHGQVAIASAKLAYQNYKEIFGTIRFRHLLKMGARAQRPLWASTGTKNPEYSDVKYIEALIGPDTVNTVPLETLIAYHDHGNPESRLGKGTGPAARLLKRLVTLGIDLDQLTQQLENEGITKFNKPFDMLMDALTRKNS